MKTAPTTPVTRRVFLLAGTSALLGACLTPYSAFGDIGGTGLQTEKTAAELWAEAVQKAHEQGCLVEYDLAPSNKPIPLSRVNGTIQSKMQLIFGIPDYITAYANYEVSSANRITTLYTAGLYGGHSKTILDNGRTMAIYYTAVLQNYAGLNQGVNVYAEFGVDGGKSIQVTLM